MTAPFTAPATIEDLLTLDDDELFEGYMSYQRGDPEPGPNRGRSFWWGWTNRRNDALGIVTPEQSRLAGLICRNGRVMTRAEMVAAVMENAP